MSKFIEITEVTKDGENRKVFVSVDKVIAVLDLIDRTFIRLIEESMIQVKESYEEIKAKLE